MFYVCPFKSRCIRLWKLYNTSLFQSVRSVTQIRISVWTINPPIIPPHIPCMYTCGLPLSPWTKHTGYIIERVWFSNRKSTALPWHLDQSRIPKRSQAGSQCRSSTRCSHMPRTPATRSQPPHLQRKKKDQCHLFNHSSHQSIKASKTNPRAPSISC